MYTYSIFYQLMTGQASTIVNHPSAMCVLSQPERHVLRVCGGQRGLGHCGVLRPLPQPPPRPQRLLQPRRATQEGQTSLHKTGASYMCIYILSIKYKESDGVDHNASYNPDELRKKVPPQLLYIYIYINEARNSRSLSSLPLSSPFPSLFIVVD